MAGLWAALPALVIYALLGSSTSLSMGPEATTALMTAVVIGPLAGGNPALYSELASTLALLVGLMSVVAWLLRLGIVADLLSRPVLIGYMVGVALIMIAGQLRRVTGIPVRGQAFFAQLDSLVRSASRAQPTTVAFATAVLAFILVLHWRWPRGPGPLLAVLLARRRDQLRGRPRSGHSALASPGLADAHCPMPLVAGETDGPKFR